MILRPDVFGFLFLGAMCVLGLTSGLWHYTEQHPHNVYDRYSMFLVLAVVAGAVLESYFMAPLSLLGAVALYKLKPVTEIVIAAQSVLIVVCLLIIGAPWWLVAAALLIAVGSTLINILGGYTSLVHSVWHIVDAGILLLAFLAPLVDKVRM